MELFMVGAVFVAAAFIYLLSILRAKEVKLPPALVPDSIPSFLRKARRVTGEYRGHQIRAERFTTSKTNPMATRIVIEANGIVKESEPLPYTSGRQDRTAEITQLLLPQPPAYRLKGTVFVATLGQRIIYEQSEHETNLDYLRFLFAYLIDLLEAYPLVVALGGEAVHSLRLIGSDPDHPLSGLAAQLLRDIELDTRNRLGAEPARYVCLQCAVRCAALTESLSLLAGMTYYGCRACGQSRDLLDWPDQRIVAVLDQTTGAGDPQEGQPLKINWLVWRDLFDFDEVWIIEATDEDVERLAVQVGNDTDPIRRPKYEQMRCLISPACHLSPNTLRVLGQVFGQVHEEPALNVTSAGSSKITPAESST
jgi:hypothetical protein